MMNYLLAFLTSIITIIELNVQKEVNADIVKVTASGQDNDYTFMVTISSPDKGCDQYADWWEVIDESGLLIYRRILLHSHVDEQPFTRSGGKVSIQSDQEVWIRAHMNNIGYGGRTMKGSPDKGFIEKKMAKSFAMGLDSQNPLPEACRF